MEARSHGIGSRRLRVVDTYLKKMAGTGKTKYLGPLKELLDGLSRETFIVFDTETTGLDQHDHQVTEIAAVAVKGSELQKIDSMHARAALTPDTMKQIEDQKSGENLPEDKRHKTVEEVLKMNKYEDSDLEARPEHDILSEFKEFCSKHNALIVGHNPEFDLRMVGTKVGRIPNRGVWDTMMFARFFFYPMLEALEDSGDETAAKVLSGIRNAKGRPQATLGKVLQALGVPIQGWHTAMADVESTVKAFQAIMAYVKEHIDVADTEGYRKHMSRAFKRVRDFKRHGYGGGNPGH